MDFNINPNKKISDLTVKEFLSLQTPKKNYAYGLKGIAKIFGCSVSKATDIKNSGIIDEAIYQNKNIIVIEVEKALELFRSKK